MRGSRQPVPFLPVPPFSILYDGLPNIHNSNSQPSFFHLDQLMIIYTLFISISPHFVLLNSHPIVVFWTLNHPNSQILQWFLSFCASTLGSTINRTISFIFPIKHHLFCCLAKKIICSCKQKKILSSQLIWPNRKAITPFEITDYSQGFGGFLNSVVLSTLIKHLNIRFDGWKQESLWQVRRTWCN